MAAYSRPLIAKEFGINERTLSWLVNTGRIQLEWRPSNGLLVCDLSDEQKKILSVAKISLLAFNDDSANWNWPFQRFLFLRFFHLDIDSQYQELIDRNIVSRAGFNKETLEILRMKFISKLPESLQLMVNEGRGPTSEQEQADLSLVLDMCDITLAFGHPELEQSFYFMTDRDIKEVFDCGISSKSTFADIQKFYYDVIGLQISVEGMAFYQQLFFDVQLVSSEFFKNYLKSIRPSFRDKLCVAVNTTIDVFRFKAGYDEKLEVDKALLLVRDELIHNLLSMLNDRAQDSEKVFNMTLRSLTTVLERLDRLGVKSKNQDSSKFFRTIKVEAQTTEKMNIFHLPPPEVKSEQVE